MDTAVEQWARFEVRLAGPSAGNPFVDVQLSAEFSNGQKRMRSARAPETTEAAVATKTIWKNQVASAALPAE